MTGLLTWGSGLAVDGNDVWVLADTEAAGLGKV